MTFKRYKQNLKIVECNGDTYVQSYSTFVAKVEGRKLIELGKWSVTTSKHVNYAAREMHLDLVRYEKCK